MIEVTDITNAEQDNNSGFWASGDTCPTIAPSLTCVERWANLDLGAGSTTLYTLSAARADSELPRCDASSWHLHTYDSKHFSTSISPP